jgi:replicative DNA helicase
VSEPQSVFDNRAEQSVLGALMTSPNLIGELGGLKAEHFFKPAHELLFNTINGMYLDGDPIDAITVFARLRESNELRQSGGAPYLADCLQAYKCPENIVKDQWKLREIHKLGQRFQNIQADAGEIPQALELAQTFLSDVDDATETGLLSFHELYAVWTDDQEDDRPAILTPFINLNDRLSGGFHRQRLYVVGARPGCGKTILGAQLAVYAALSHHKSLIFSLELSKSDLMGRILAMGARVPYKEITSKKLTADSMGRISQWAGAAASMSLEVDDDPEQTIETISQACRIQKQRHGLDFVFIDYLQLVEASKGGDNRVQQVDHIAKGARAIARKLDCVVVVAAQLNRNIEEHGRPRLPNKSDFRESGGIEQTADVCLALSRPPNNEGEEDATLPMMNLSIIKNRTGTEGVLQLVERFNEARFQ